MSLKMDIDMTDGSESAISRRSFSNSIIGDRVSIVSDSGITTASDRVTEKFAEQVEKVRSHQKSRAHTSYDRALSLLTSYHNISEQETQSLKRKQTKTRRKQLSAAWRHRLRELYEKDDASSILDEDGDKAEVEKEVRQWEQETQTWDLIHLLLPFSYPRPGVDKNADKQSALKTLGPVHFLSSEENIWKRFLVEDDVAHERQATLQWLERHADAIGEDISLIVDKIEEGAERGKGLWASSWLYTKEAIKAQKRLYAGSNPIDPSSPGASKRLMSSDKTQPLITQLDPDAVTRQDRQLESQDRYFERAIWLACWEMLRRGQSWTQVRQWCVERVEGWRAVSLRGGIAAWDTIIDGERKPETSQEVAEENARGTDIVTGNRNRALWRMMCGEIAKNGGIDDYERAVYGVLSGDYKSVAAVCHSWDDYLYAHYNSLLSNQFDAYLKLKFPERAGPITAQRKGNLDLLHHDVKTANRRIVESLNSNPQTKTEAELPMKLVQSALISQRFLDLVFATGHAISVSANAESHSAVIPPYSGTAIPRLDIKAIEPDDFDSIRVLLHLLIVFRELGLDLQGSDLEMAENVIVNYVVFLQMFGKLDLVPLYASLLSESRRVSVLARFCLGISEDGPRNRVMKQMNQYNIDVQSVIAEQLEVLSKQLYPLEQETAGYSPKIINSSDERFTNQSDGIDTIVANFIGKTDHPEDEALIRSFEWFMFIDGFFAETFAAGAGLARRFLRRGRLNSLRTLMRRVPASRISLEKSISEVGVAIDITRHIYELDDQGGFQLGYGAIPTLTLPKGVSAEKLKSLIDHAKEYSDHEHLISALDSMERWKAEIDVLSRGRLLESSKASLELMYDDVVQKTSYILRQWQGKPFGNDELDSQDRIRRAYLPEVIIAFNSVHIFAGRFLKTEYLTRSMDLSVEVARPGSDVATVILEQGRMEDILKAFMTASYAMMQVNEERGQGHALRARDGEHMDIWSVEEIPRHQAGFSTG